MVGGQFQVMFDNMPSWLELVKAGKIRALAVSTEKRSDQFLMSRQLAKR